MSAPERPGFLERLAHRHFARDPDAPPVAGPEGHDPPSPRWRVVRQTRTRTLALSAAAGVLGVLLLHLPRYWLPDAARWWTVAVPLGAYSFELPLAWTVYGLGLAVVEIGGLVLLNVRAVRRIARACEFPSGRDPDRDLHLRSLAGISVEAEARRELALGLNPWQGYSRARIALVFVASRVKATLSNVVVKLLLRRILGRYAVRLTVDLAGIPVFAFWNAWAAGRVLDAARARVLAPELVRWSVAHFRARHGPGGAFAVLIYDVLQYLAVLRRAFDESHYLLALSLLRAFEVRPRGAHEVGEDLVARLGRLDPGTREDVCRLVLIGMVVDGRLSWRERRAIRRLRQAGVLDRSVADVRWLVAAFTRGDGVDAVRRELRMDP